MSLGNYPVGWRRRWPQALLWIGATLLAHACAADGEVHSEQTYRVAFQAKLAPDEGTARVTITVDQDRNLLRELDFNIDPATHDDFRADGEWQTQAGRLRWELPPAGGSISFRVAIPHQRSPGRYDAWMDDSWALFRGDDLFPPAKVRSAPGSQAMTTLTVQAPAGWSVVTPYGAGANKVMPVNHPERRFDRPTGWMVAGAIGVRKDLIGTTEAVVAGPVAQGVRRQDMLALLNWTLPTLGELFGPLPARLVIVSAGDPMWRGGLSGPDSLFIHADRPMISENGTSSLVHELVHVVLGVSGRANDDWLVEGVAEYYALEVLRRSGTISQRRFELAHEQLASWGADVRRLDKKNSRGEVTARAVGLLRALNTELVARGSGLEAAINEMRGAGTGFSGARLARAAEKVAGGPLPGFRAELDGLLGQAP
jgi:hypothetical protein